MLLETYAAPAGIKTRGRIPQNLRIIDMNNIRIRPDNDELDYCILYRKNEKMLTIFESYTTISARLRYASDRGRPFAAIRAEEGIVDDIV